MLSYRHGFHAGNAADVLKHAILIFCLDYLTQKEKPLLCVDTHAGAGLYPLGEGFSAQKREWEKGVGKLCALTDSSATGRAAGLDAPPVMLRRYLQICAAAADRAGSGGSVELPAFYPGSPLIMSRLLRPADRLVCFEKHSADFALCKANLQAERFPVDRDVSPNIETRRADFALCKANLQAEVYNSDGFTGLKGLLPPPSRRGFVLIDPSYEVKDDYRRVLETAGMALKRFSSGVYIIWYPLLRYAPFGDTADAFSAQLMDLYDGNRCRIELYTARPEAPPANSPRGMYGSGLVVYNPPWTLKAALEETLPVLGASLGTGEYIDFAAERNPAAAGGS
jgi:23S rRNA (adenine2030-N6)-methyltransferase